jgi:hypothetical protein
VKALADQLHSIEVKIEDEDVYMVLLMSLPSSFDNLVTSLDSMSTKDVDLQFIVPRLLHEISKRKESENIKNATLINKTNKANEKLCFYCKKPGHFVRNCLKKKSDEKEKANQACEDQEQMFVTALGANDHTTYHWIIDFGATQHMTFERDSPLTLFFHGRCIWEMTPFWRPLAKGASRPQCKLEVECCLQPSLKFFMFPK